MGADTIKRFLENWAAPKRAPEPAPDRQRKEVLSFNIPLELSRKLRVAYAEVKQGTLSPETVETLELASAWFEEYTNDPDAIGRPAPIDVDFEEKEN